jgi:hypothetical protein
MSADSNRHQTEYQIHLGIHASWTNCGNQLRYEPVPIDTTSKPNSTTNIDAEGAAIKLAGSVASQLGLRPCHCDPSFPPRQRSLLASFQGLLARPTSSARCTPVCAFLASCGSREILPRGRCSCRRQAVGFDFGQCCDHAAEDDLHSRVVWWLWRNPKCLARTPSGQQCGLRCGVLLDHVDLLGGHPRSKCQIYRRKVD